MSEEYKCDCGKDVVHDKEVAYDDLYCSQKCLDDYREKRRLAGPYIGATMMMSPTSGYNK
jgi:hypothetical protein